MPAARGAVITALFLAVGCSATRICDSFNTDLSIVADALKEVLVTVKNASFFSSLMDVPVSVTWYCTRCI